MSASCFYFFFFFFSSRRRHTRFDCDWSSDVCSSDLAEEIRQKFDRVVLCGMGGSSLAPEVLWRTFGRKPGYPALAVLDSTDPRAVVAALGGEDIARSLFLVSSKSGTTQETDCLYRHFWEQTRGRGAQFVAITDPDTPR